MVVAVGSPDPEGAVGFEFEPPVPFMSQMVMLGTQREEVVEVGWSAVFPGDHVVDLAVVEPAVT